MGLTLVTPPAAEPISLAEAKAHLRVDGTDDDTLITALIVAAREHVESVTRRALITQTWDYSLPAFPNGDVLALPRPRLQSVTSVTYTDSAGVAATFAASNYLVDTASYVGRLVLGYAKDWPVFTERPINAVVVRFVAGYGPAAADVPRAIRHALLLLVAEWYERREATHVGMTGASAVTPLPFAVNALLAPHRVWGF